MKQDKANFTDWKATLDKLPDIGNSARPEHRKLLRHLRKKKPKDLDAQVHELHHQAFEVIDCLACGNCCKTTSPRFLMTDIERLAKFFSEKPADFIAQHLHIDEDGDYVLNETPCPFLLPDNYCLAYEARPKACREFPHTDHRKFYRQIGVTMQNTSICPAVYHIVEALNDIY